MPLPDEDQHQDPIPPEFETGVSAGSTYNNTFTTSWSVVALDKKSIGVTTSVVVSGVIQVSASSADGYEAEFKQRVDFDVSGGISTNFISYENLTNDDELKTVMLSTLKETHSTFQQSSSFLQTISRIELLTGVDFSYKLNSSAKDFLVYQMNFNFWLDSAYLNFGFSNYFQYDKLTNVLLNLPFNESTRFYYGLIRSSPGFGIKHHFPYTYLSTSINMYNFESPLFDIGVHYKMLNKLFLNAGYFELNKPTRSAFFGFSIQGNEY